MTSPLLTLVDYDASYLDPLVHLWREAFEFGVGVTDPHPLSEQRDYFVSQVLPANHVTIALLSGRLVGFVAASAESVTQLHVQVGLHRLGIGSALLALAKERSSGSLCVRIRRNVRPAASTRNMASSSSSGFEPHWQLEDVKYCWSADNAAT